jgi:hypothetical protein
VPGVCPFEQVLPHDVGATLVPVGQPQLWDGVGVDEIPLVAVEFATAFCIAEALNPLSRP